MSARPAPAPPDPQGTPVFIGVDAGSASVRAALYTAGGARLALAVRPIQQFRSSGERVEQSSADIWQQTCSAVREAVAASGVALQQIAGLGFDATCSLVAVGPGGTAVSWSDDGDPTHDTIMWMDHRAAAEAQAINATGDPALAYVGGAVSLEMELPKILWLRRHFPQRYADTERFFDLADYLVWRSAGADVASVCTLTCKWNYLAHEGRFPETLLSAVGLADVQSKIPATILPLACAAGTLTPQAAQELGLHCGVVVATGIIDAHAGGLALVGAQPQGSVAVITGTSTCHMAVSSAPVMVPGVWGPYFGAMLPGLWLNEGGQSAAGALIDWTVSQHAAWPQALAQAKREQRSVYAVLNTWVADLQAREAAPTRHLHVLPDHHGNRSPRANPSARGSVSGLTLESGPQALARLYLATLQALAYGTRHIVERMNACGHRIDRVVLCGGGAKNPLLLQETANALGCAVHLVAEDEAMTLGAALLAATACGAFATLAQAAAAMVRAGACIHPDASQAPFHDAKYRVFLQLYDDQQRCRDLMESYPC